MSPDLTTRQGRAAARDRLLALTCGLGILVPNKTFPNITEVKLTLHGVKGTLRIDPSEAVDFHYHGCWWTDSPLGFSDTFGKVFGDNRCTSCSPRKVVTVGGDFGVYVSQIGRAIAVIASGDANRNHDEVRAERGFVSRLADNLAAGRMIEPHPFEGPHYDPVAALGESVAQ